MMAYGLHKEKQCYASTQRMKYYQTLQKPALHMKGIRVSMMKGGY
jgi:hypothetical protein